MPIIKKNSIYRSFFARSVTPVTIRYSYEPWIVFIVVYMQWTICWRMSTFLGLLIEIDNSLPLHIPTSTPTQGRWGHYSWRGAIPCAPLSGATTESLQRLSDRYTTADRLEEADWRKEFLCYSRQSYRQTEPAVDYWDSPGSIHCTVPLRYGHRDRRVDRAQADRSRVRRFQDLQ